MLRSFEVTHSPTFLTFLTCVSIYIGRGDLKWGLINIPGSKHEALAQCWADVGPASLFFQLGFMPLEIILKNTHKIINAFWRHISTELELGPNIFLW